MTPITKASNLLADFPASLHNFFRDDVWDSSWVAKVPAANILEHDQDFTLELAAPGLSKEAFELNIEQGYLNIASKQEQEKETEEENYTRREFSYQAFERSFMIPENVDIDNINAHYENGVLKVILPKLSVSPTVEKKQIKIK